MTELISKLSSSASQWVYKKAAGFEDSTQFGTGSGDTHGFTGSFLVKDIMGASIQDTWVSEVVPAAFGHYDFGTGLNIVNTAHGASISRNSTGDYTVTFASPEVTISDSDYIIFTDASNNDNQDIRVTSKTLSSFDLELYGTGSSPSLEDYPFSFEIYSSTPQKKHTNSDQVISPIIVGEVTGGTTNSIGSPNFSVSRFGTGQYFIQFTEHSFGSPDDYVVLTDIPGRKGSPYRRYAQIVFRSTDFFAIDIKEDDGSGTTLGNVDATFNFLVYDLEEVPLQVYDIPTYNPAIRPVAVARVSGSSAGSVETSSYGFSDIQVIFDSKRSSDLVTFTFSEARSNTDYIVMNDMETQDGGSPATDSIISIYKQPSYFRITRNLFSASPFSVKVYDSPFVSPISTEEQNPKQIEMTADVSVTGSTGINGSLMVTGSTGISGSLLVTGSTGITSGSFNIISGSGVNITSGDFNLFVTGGTSKIKLSGSNGSTIQMSASAIDTYSELYTYGGPAPVSADALIVPAAIGRYSGSYSSSIGMTITRTSTGIYTASLDNGFLYHPETITNTDYFVFSDAEDDDFNNVTIDISSKTTSGFNIEIYDTGSNLIDAPFSLEVYSDKPKRTNWATGNKYVISPVVVGKFDRKLGTYGQWVGDGFTATTSSYAVHDILFTSFSPPTNDYYIFTDIEELEYSDTVRITNKTTSGFTLVTAYPYGKGTGFYNDEVNFRVYPADLVDHVNTSGSTSFVSRHPVAIADLSGTYSGSPSPQTVTINEGFSSVGWVSAYSASFVFETPMSTDNYIVVTDYEISDDTVGSYAHSHEIQNKTVNGFELRAGVYASGKRFAVKVYESNPVRTVSIIENTGSTSQFTIDTVNISMSGSIVTTGSQFDIAATNILMSGSIVTTGSVHVQTTGTSSWFSGNPYSLTTSGYDNVVVGDNYWHFNSGSMLLGSTEDSFLEVSGLLMDRRQQNSIQLITKNNIQLTGSLIGVTGSIYANNNVYNSLLKSTATSITASAGDAFLAISASGPTSVLLPPAEERLELTIADVFGSAGTNTITINASGSNKIQGASSLQISTNFGAVTFIAYDSTNWQIKSTN